MEVENAKEIIDYERQIVMFGKERADTALQFFMLGANGYGIKKTNRDKIWSVFEKAYRKYRSKQIEDDYEVHKKEVVDIIESLFPF